MTTSRFIKLASKDNGRKEVNGCGRRQGAGMVKAGSFQQRSRLGLGSWMGTETWKATSPSCCEPKAWPALGIRSPYR